jgi:drug/metabolite transporter (DMT)-like permease
MFEAAAALAGQSILSLYPIAVKTIDASIFSQMLVRFAVFPLIAFLLGGVGSLAATWGSWSAAAISIGLGLMNVLHIYSSYVAFDELQAGLSMSIFYIYPILGIIGARIFFGERLHAWMFPFFALALIATYIIASAAPETVVYEKKAAATTAPAQQQQQPSQSSLRGIIAVLISALTEAGTYIAVRTSPTDDPYANIQRIYLGGLLALLVAMPFIKSKLDLTATTTGQLGLFNGLIGFVGYALLYWSARFLPAYAYAIMAFVGVATAYVFGAAFVGETPNGKAVGGAALLLASVSAVQVLAGKAV